MLAFPWAAARFWVLGPNGSGKSTTMKMVTGFLSPTSGTALVCGNDVTRDPITVKRHIGYLPEGAPLYEDMTPAALFGFVANVRGLSGTERRSAIDHAVTKLQLDEVYNQQIGTLSKGFKRRVGLARAILHDPDVLILDEPTDGLDPNQKHQVRELIAEMSADKAIVISTHVLEEVDAVCSRAIVIAWKENCRRNTQGPRTSIGVTIPYRFIFTQTISRDSVARLTEWMIFPG